MTTFLPGRDGAVALTGRLDRRAHRDGALLPNLRILTAFSTMTARTPSPYERPSRDFPLGSSADSPFRLLGEAIRESSAQTHESTGGLRALVTYTAEYARLHGAVLADYLGALESTLEVHSTEKDTATRERLRIAIRHWGRLAYGEAAGPPAGGH